MSILTTDDGLIRFYDGTIIAIESQEYSADGTTNWETTFNPNTHVSTLDGVTSLAGHKYKRVKHSGDTTFQLPYKIVADTPEFRVSGDNFEWKFEDSTTWNLLLDTTTLKGDTGNTGQQGIAGEGFKIDDYGFYQSRPTSSTEGNTFMSLGDGTLKLTSALIAAGTVTVDLVAYSHFSNDLVTWTALTAGIVDFQARYLATNGTGAVYTDMQTENYYGSRGVVYLYANGVWTVNLNVATPSYQIGEATGSTNIGFLDNFVLTSSNNLTGTISIDTGKLEIIEQSIDETALKQTIIGNGLEILTPMAKPQVKSADFAGFGLSTYTSTTDGLEDIQIAIDTLVTDGLSTAAAVTVDGETRTQAYVDVTDLINNTSFLTAAANPTPDTFNDLYVNIGLGLVSDGGTPAAIDVDVDALSLMVDATSLRVKPYTAGNDGIMTTHLNPDVIYTNRGIALDTLNGLYARIDASTIGYDGSGQLYVLDNGITGVKLNSAIADTTKGLAYASTLGLEKLYVKVDGTSIDFDGSGQLYFTGDVSAAITASSDTVIKAITVNDNGVAGNTVRDSSILRVNDGAGTTANITAVSATDTITIDFDVDTTWLNAQMAAYILANPVATTAWGGLTGTITSQTDLVTYVTSTVNHFVKDGYAGSGNIKVKSSNPNAGLIIKSSGNIEYQLIVDDQGNLDTVAV